MTGTDPGARAARQGRVIRELVAVHRLTETRLNRVLRPLGLSMTQLTVITHLQGTPDGATVGELAAVMEIHQPGVSKIVSALQARGAVELGSVPGDGRRKVVRLTAVGRQLLLDARIALHPEATSILLDLDDGRLDALHDALLAMRRRLDGVPPEA